MRFRAKFVHVIAVALMPLIALGQNPLPEKAAPTNSKEVASRTIEDGGTGPYKAIMASDGSLPTHTVFGPKDLRPFGDKLKLPIIAWGNGACANSPWEHVNFLSEIASHGYLVVAIGPHAGRRTKRWSGRSNQITPVD